MKSETYTFTPESVANINGEALDGKPGFVQGYKDERGSFVAVLIPCSNQEREGLVSRIKASR